MKKYIIPKIEVNTFLACDIIQLSGQAIGFGMIADYSDFEYEE